MAKALLLIFLVLPSIVFAQIREESLLPVTVDARSAALGRASITTAEGSSAIGLNPALLASLSQMQLQGGGTLFWGSIEDQSQSENYDASFSPHLTVGHFAFSSPHPLRNPNLTLAYGIGYQTYLDFGFKTVEKEEVEVISSVSGGLRTISPAIAIGIQEKFFFGLSFNKSFLGEITTQVDDQNREETIVSTLESSGSFFLFGALAKFAPVTIGLIHRTAFEWQWKLEGGTDVDWDLPSVLGLGVSYQASDKLLLVGEYQSRKFSKYRRGSTANAFGLRNGHNLRLGAELQESIPLRFGLFRDTITANDVGDNAPRPLYGLTGGLGFDVGKIHFDTSLEYAFWSREVGESEDYSENLVRFRTSIKYIFRKSALLTRSKKTPRPEKPLLPVAPRLSRPLNRASAVSINPRLSWNAVDRADTYRLQVSTASNYSDLFIDEGRLRSTFFEVTSLSYATTYYWRVQAVNTADSSDWSRGSFTTEAELAPTEAELAPTEAELALTEVDTTETELAGSSNLAIKNLEVLRNEVQVPTGEVEFVEGRSQPVLETRRSQQGYVFLNLTIEFTYRGAPFSLRRSEVELRRPSDSASFSPIFWEQILAKGLLTKQGQTFTINDATTIRLVVEVPDGSVDELLLYVKGTPEGSVGDLRR